jgi:hypothetical protein
MADLRIVEEAPRATLAAPIYRGNAPTRIGVILQCFEIFFVVVAAAW